MITEDYVDAIEDRLRDPMVTYKENVTEDAPLLVGALNEVIRACDELEKEYQASPDHGYQQGLEEAAHRIRNVIEAKLTREDQP